MPVNSYIISGYNKKPISIDISTTKDENGPLLLFIHGFKGFKDWGQFPLLSNKFNAEKVNFASFNFSHNGTSPDSPIDFVDLDAFARNTFSIELQELRLVVDWLMEQNGKSLKFDANRVHLLGHSRGGAIAILANSVDPRVKSTISWAAVDDLGRLFESFDKTIWAKQGVVSIYNSRTKQIMPLNYTLYTDYSENKEDSLNILQAAKKLENRQLIIHGTEDSSVNCSAAMNLHKANPESVLHLLEGADHTFGGKHPWDRSDLPNFTMEAMAKTIEFIHCR